MKLGILFNFITVKFILQMSFLPVEEIIIKTIHFCLWSSDDVDEHCIDEAWLHSSNMLSANLWICWRLVTEKGIKDLNFVLKKKQANVYHVFQTSLAERHVHDSSEIAKLDYQ